MLRDHLFANPWSFVAGCAIWIPVGIWIVSLIHWMVQADVDALTGFTGILVAAGLGMTGMISRNPIIAPATFFGMVGTLIAFPIARGAFQRRQLDKIDIEAIERAYELLDRQPGNAAAKFKLAKTVYNKGMVAYALTLAEDAIQSMPESVFFEEHRILNSWRNYRIPAGQRTVLDCLKCGKPNQPGFTHCQRCGAPFLLDHARGSWIGTTLAKKFVAAWIGIMVALIGIPLASTSLNPSLAIFVIVALMLAAGGVVFAAFRSGGSAS